MCTIKAPKPDKSAQNTGAAPAAPLPTAERFKMNERTTYRDGDIRSNNARSRRSMRTDIRISGSSGANVARMG